MADESEHDTEDARRPPDYKVASVALYIAQSAAFMRRCGVDFETFERIRMLADEINDAISNRGCRVGELVSALRSVKPDGSILRDLPTMRAKPPMGRPEE